jgi:hypothetical protein
MSRRFVCLRLMPLGSVFPTAKENQPAFNVEEPVCADMVENALSVKNVTAVGMYRALPLTKSMQTQKTKSPVFRMWREQVSLRLLIIVCVYTLKLKNRAANATEVGMRLASLTFFSICERDLNNPATRVKTRKRKQEDETENPDKST